MGYNLIYNDNGNVGEDLDLKQALELLKDMQYKYIIKAVDKLTSGWGKAVGKKHIQLIAVKDSIEKDRVMSGLRQDNKEFAYIDFNNINDYKKIYAWTRGKIYTLRNDWTRYN